MFGTITGVAGEYFPEMSCGLMDARVKPAHDDRERLRRAHSKRGKTGRSTGDATRNGRECGLTDGCDRSELYPKRLQLLKELNPKLSRVAILYKPDHPFHVRAVEEVRAIAPALSLEMSVVAAQKPEHFASAFSDVVQRKAEALYVVEDPIFFSHRKTLLDLAATQRIPTIHELARWPKANALISYGPDLHDLFRRAALLLIASSRGPNLPICRWSSPRSSNWS
jgi:hypothetical protein